MKNFLEKLIKAKYYETKNEADEIIGELIAVNLLTTEESTKLLELVEETYTGK